MNLAKLHQKLIAAARSNPPGEHVPYAFEQRVLAHLRAGGLPLDHWASWAAALWRATVPCVALTMLLGAWSFFAASPTSTDWAQDLDNTVLAAVDHVDAEPMPDGNP